MAEEKNGIIVYADWIETFDALSDEEAGRLIKHFFRYVNDLDPVAPDRVTDLLFLDLKRALKRDLKKWEKAKEDRAYAGMVGNLKRWHPDLFKRFEAGILNIQEAMKIVESRKLSLPDKPDTVATKTVAKVAVNDTVSVNVSTKVDEEKIHRPLSVADSNKIRHETYMSICLSLEEQAWREVSMMDLKIPPEAFESAIRDYNNHLIMQSESHQTISKYKSHFVNWARKRKQIKADQERKKNEGRP